MGFFFLVCGIEQRGFFLYYVKRLGNVSYEFDHDGAFVVVPIIWSAGSKNSVNQCRQLLPIWRLSRPKGQISYQQGPPPPLFPYFPPFLFEKALSEYPTVPIAEALKLTPQTSHLSLQSTLLSLRNIDANPPQHPPSTFPTQPPFPLFPPFKDQIKIYTQNTIPSRKPASQNEVDTCRIQLAVCSTGRNWWIGKAISWEYVVCVEMGERWNWNMYGVYKEFIRSL